MADLISSKDFQIFWDRDPIVVLDSCSVLDLYRYSSDTTKRILDNFHQNYDNLWIPSQVLYEYNKNRATVRTEAFNKYKNVTKEVSSIISEANTDISKKFIRYGKFKFPKISDFKERIENKVEELLKEVREFDSIIAEEIELNSKTLKLIK